MDSATRRASLGPRLWGYRHEDREGDLRIAVAHIVVVVLWLDKVADPDEFGNCVMQRRYRGQQVNRLLYTIEDWKAGYGIWRVERESDLLVSASDVTDEIF